MAFDPDAMIARLGPAPSAGGGFDPDAMVARLSQGGPAPSDDLPDAPAGGGAEDGPGLLEGIARGVKQGATLGLADEATGAIEALLTSKSYEQARDEARANDKAAQKAHPWGFGIGEALGGVATPGLGAAGSLVKGASLAAKVGRGALTGALAGGVSGIGNSESKDIGGIAKDAGKGALIGGGLGAALGGTIGHLVEGAPARVDQRLLGDIGNRANKTVRDKISAFSEGTLETARKFDLDKVAHDPEALLSAASTARKEVGQSIGDTYEAVDKAFLGVKTGDMLKALKNVESEYGGPARANLKSQITKLQDEVKTSWGSDGRVPLAKVNQMVGDLESVGFASADIAPGASKQLNRNVAKAVDDVLDARMSEIHEFASHVKAQPSAGQSAPLAESMSAADQLSGLKDLNKNYRALKLIEKAADQRAKLDAFPPNGLRQIASGGIETGALLGSIATGNPLPFLAAKVGIPLVKAGARAGDELLSKIALAASAGSPTAALVKKAIEQGIPRGAIAAAVAGAGSPGAAK